MWSMLTSRRLARLALAASVALPLAGCASACVSSWLPKPDQSCAASSPAVARGQAMKSARPSFG